MRQRRIITTPNAETEEQTLGARLVAAKIAAAHLSEETDKLTQTLLGVEKVLAALSLGVAVEIALVPRTGPGGAELRFARTQSVWGLLVTGEKNDWPLVNAPRTLRIVAAAKLPELVDKLLAAVAPIRIAVQDATTTAGALLRDLEAYRFAEPVEPGAAP